MSDGPVLGIDLGTTNSVVAIADGGQARVLTDPDGRRMVPSVVAFAPDGETLVGYAARERRLVDAANTVYAVKRLIGRPFASPEVARARERFAFEIVPNKHGGSVVKVGRGTYALAEISAMVLRELRRIAENNLGEAADRAVITVPANFNELQRSATKAAGKVAGLEVLRIVNEPTAAALAYGYGGEAQGRVAVYDLGGGTFDITILELEGDVFEVLSTAGDTFLGGEDIDRALAEVMCDRFKAQHKVDPRTDGQAFERLKAAAEWAKCQLSNEDAVELTVEDLLVHRGKTLDLVFEMTRAELEAITLPWLRRSFEVCDGALSSAGVRPSEIDSVVLVGGSTRMPLCRRMVESYFQREPRTDIDPDMVVAQGAAIQGYALGGPREAPRAIPKPRKPLRRKATDVGRPNQPAFAPDELDQPLAPEPQSRPARSTRPPPPMPDLPAPSSPPPAPAIPPPAVRISRAVEVRTPKTTIELELDELSPPDAGIDPLRDVAPPSSSFDPFADLVPDGGALPLPIEDLPSFPGEKPVPSREPTTPFSLDRHAPRPPPPPPPKKIASPPIPKAPAVEPPKPRVRDPVQSFQPAAISVVPMPPKPPPLLLDVTPHSLGIETAGGYCKKIILKNAPVPTEQMRSFTSAKDDQTEVAVRVCQGEEEAFDKNEVLGEVVLDQLAPGPRGSVSIAVTFMLDGDGTLGVEARDEKSGRVQRTRITLRGGISAEEIDAMRERQEAEER
jgi:molecular chaperone DnaK